MITLLISLLLGMGTLIVFLALIVTARPHSPLSVLGIIVGLAAGLIGSSILGAYSITTMSGGTL